MPPVLRRAQKNPPTVAGVLFQRTWMSTSSDNVPSSASNWEFESKRVPSPRASVLIVKESSRVDGRARTGRKDELLNIAEAIFPDNTGYFVSSLSPSLPPCACILWITRDSDAFRFFRRRRRSSGECAIAAQRSGRTWKNAAVKRGVLIRCLRPYRPTNSPSLCARRYVLDSPLSVHITPRATSSARHS